MRLIGLFISLIGRWVVFETCMFLGTLIRSIGRGHEWVVFELYLFLGLFISPRRSLYCEEVTIKK